MTLIKLNGNMKQFEVYLVTFDPTIGAEMKKTRPAVIVSPDPMNKNLLSMSLRDFLRVSPWNGLTSMIQNS